MFFLCADAVFRSTKTNSNVWLAEMQVNVGRRSRVAFTENRADKSLLRIKALCVIGVRKNNVGSSGSNLCLFFVGVSSSVFAVCAHKIRLPKCAYLFNDWYKKLNIWVMCDFKFNARSFQNIITSKLFKYYFSFRAKKWFEMYLFSEQFQLETIPTMEFCASPYI